MLEFKIGNNSVGEMVSKNLLQLNHLFISHFENAQFKNFYEEIVLNSHDIIKSCLLVCSEENLINTQKLYKIDTFVYDNPLIGNIKEKKNIFNTIYKSFLKQKSTSKNNFIQLIIIDDLWQITPHFSKRSVKQFKELLIESADFGIHFIIGSSMPFRNLLLQLMNSNKQKSPLNELGAELVFNPDDLIFFREKNVLNYDMFYPIEHNKFEFQKAISEAIDIL